MAEGNVSHVPKKRRSTGDRGVQYSINIELPRDQESRLLGIKGRVKMAKSALNLTKATSSTQNADLLEALLLAFEEKMQRRNIITSPRMSSPRSCTISTPSTSQIGSPVVTTSTPKSRTSLPFSTPVSPIQPPESSTLQSSFSPQKFQVSTPVKEDDQIYLCSEEVLHTVSFFYCYIVGEMFVSWEALAAWFHSIQ